MGLIKEGQLVKQGGRFRTWKKRWFILSDEGSLSYFKDKSDKEPAGVVALKGYTVAKADDSKANAFRLSGPSLRTYLLQAESPADQDDWVRKIASATTDMGGMAAINEDEEMDSFLDAPKLPKVRIEDFDLLKVIGRGAFGKVMLVRKKDSQKLYAMKILSKDMIIKRKQVDRTKAERRILRSVDHPYVVGLKFAFQAETKLYLVLDFVSGGDMFTHLQSQRRFAVDQVRLYAAEMVVAFEHLHKVGIVYRDLKPENILMGSDGHIRLTDFGLSKEAMKADDTTSSFCGTPEYLAPEVLQNQGYGKDVDWWSLGILVYEMMVGRPPFYSENVNEMYDKILHDRLAFPSSVAVPADAKDLLEQLLVRDPKSRLGTGEADAQPIRSHPFFASMDWDALLRKEIDSAYKPQIKGDMDTSNFDSQFTSEPVIQTVVDSKISGEDQAKFQGFTYADESELAK